MMDLLILILISVTLVMLVVSVHQGMFQLLDILARRLTTVKPRHIAIGIIIGLIAHLLEILLFAGGMQFLVGQGKYGELISDHPVEFTDVVYFSAITYTTVGYGDITPTNWLRFIVAIESLTGVVLVAWTASLIFIGVQRIGTRFERSYDEPDDSPPGMKISDD